MKEPIAVTAGGGASIAAEGWPEAVLVALAVGAAFGLGGWFADCRLATVLAVVRSFCEEAAVYYAARADGRIDDAADRLFTDIEATAWSADGVRLCESCDQSKMRRGVSAGLRCCQRCRTNRARGRDTAAKSIVNDPAVRYEKIHTYTLI